ncbi:MAG: heavy metal sensor histidine kinase [Burkholderiales bacterium]
MRTRSITLQLTLLFAGASAVVLIAIGVLVSELVEGHLAQQDLTELSGKLELVRHRLERVRAPDELNDAATSLADALVGHHDLAARLVGPDGGGLLTSGRAAFPQALLAEARADAPIRPWVWRHDDRSYRGIAAAVDTGISGSPPAVVALALDIGHHLDFMAAFRKSLALAIASGIALIALFGWAAARRGLAPMRAMARATQEISASRLSERLPLAAVPDELVHLATALNDMLARLEASFQRLSDFSSDLAHELRTPISNLMTQTEVAVSKARSADEYREVLYSNLEEYERLARMITDMLFLAQADHGLMVPRREQVELAVEVQALFAFYDAYADERGVGLVLDGQGAVEGDRLMIRRALGNLLSNAIHHTARGGTIQVRVTTRPSGETEVCVENPGDAIPTEHLQRVFERFHRVDPSRQKSSDGVGLGLAITKSIVQAHGATIRVTCVDGWTRFEIKFPPRASGGVGVEFALAPDSDGVSAEVQSHEDRAVARQS